MVTQLRVTQYLGQAIFYLGLVLFIGYFADVPEFEYMPADQAEIKLIVRHSSKLLGECHAPDAVAQAKLPRNMRAPIICPRERSPLQVTLSLNGEPLFNQTILPAGFHQDGISAAFQRFQVTPGLVHVQVTINDKAGDIQSTYQYDEQVSLLPAESVAVEFSGGFTLHQEDRNHVRD